MDNLNQIFMALKRACFNEALTAEEAYKRVSNDFVYVPKHTLVNFKFFSWKDLLRAVSYVKDPGQFSQAGGDVYKMRVVLYDIVMDVYFAYTPKMSCNFRLLRVEKICFTRWFTQYHQAIVEAAKNHPEQFEASRHYFADRYGERKIEVSDIVQGIADQCVQCTLRGNGEKIAINSRDFRNKYHSDGVVIIGSRTQSEIEEGKKPFVVVTAFLKDKKGKK